MNEAIRTPVNIDAELMKVKAQLQLQLKGSLDGEPQLKH